MLTLADQIDSVVEKLLETEEKVLESPEEAADEGSLAGPAVGASAFEAGADIA